MPKNKSNVSPKPMRLTELAHNYLSTHLKPGDQTIDATAGNGYDTAYMASLVGPEGCVTAIDIQKLALDATRECLKKRQCLKSVRLIIGEHSEVLQSLCSRHAQTISAITFNLGYLPGSDHQIRTTAETTLRALNASQKLLKPDGLLLVTAYRGHNGAQTEADSVAQWTQQLENSNWSVNCHDPELRGNKQPPILFIIRKLTK